MDDEIVSIQQNPFSTWVLTNHTETACILWEELGRILELSPTLLGKNTSLCRTGHRCQDLDIHSFFLNSFEKSHPSTSPIFAVENSSFHSWRIDDYWLCCMLQSSIFQPISLAWKARSYSCDSTRDTSCQLYYSTDCLKVVEGGLLLHHHLYTASAPLNMPHATTCLLH